MVTGHFNFKTLKHVLVLVVKVMFYIVLSFTICMLILVAIHKVSKDLMSDILLNF